MRGLSSWLRDRAGHVWERIVEHPFVVELYEGTLPEEKFRFYVAQDYNYLVGLTRTMSIIASKAPVWAAGLALEIAHADATIEMENYKRLLPRAGLTLEGVLSMEPAPTNVAYMNFMIATASLGTALEGLVAVLPCFWTYRVIAERHREKLDGNPVGLYREWASVYLTREYAQLVDRLRSAVDRLYEEEGGDRERLARIFLAASRYEYMFWDMAYRMEAWPV